MASVVDICNYALSHLGVSDEIASLTERSEEAQACNRFYEQTRDEVLRDFDWPFARRIADLGLVEADPTVEWGFAYRYPSDAVALRKLPNGSGIRMDTADSRVKFSVGSDTSGRLIFSDQETATVAYTVRVEDVTQFPPDFVQLVALKLAGYIAPRVTGGDQFKLGIRALQLYAIQLGIATANAANESVPDAQPDAEMILARES